MAQLSNKWPLIKTIFGFLLEKEDEQNASMLAAQRQNGGHDDDEEGGVSPLGTEWAWLGNVNPTL